MKIVKIQNQTIDKEMFLQNLHNDSTTYTDCCIEWFVIENEQLTNTTFVNCDICCTFVNCSFYNISFKEKCSFDCIFYKTTFNVDGYEHFKTEFSSHCINNAIFVECPDVISQVQQKEQEMRKWLEERAKEERQKQKQKEEENMIERASYNAWLANRE